MKRIPILAVLEIACAVSAATIGEPEARELALGFRNLSGGRMVDGALNGDIAEGFAVDGDFDGASKTVAYGFNFTRSARSC